MIRLFTVAVLLAISPTVVIAHGTVWVLWEKSVLYKPTEDGRDSGKTTWSVRSAHESREVCNDGAAKGGWRGALQALQDDKIGAGKVATFKRHDPSWLILVTYTDGSRQMLDWICLPDTIDPRR